MSPDNHHNSPYIKRLIIASNGLSTAFPNLAKYLLADTGVFRGLTFFIGDSADYVVGLRVFGDDGGPEVLWSSGAEPILALINLDRQLGSGNFKVDKAARGTKPSP